MPKSGAIQGEPTACVAGTQATALYDRLRTDILTCLLLPGEKLRIETLCEAYGTGASPVREALNRLVTHGFVTQIDQKGFRVAPISVDEMNDLTRARSWIGERALIESIHHGDAAWEERVLLAFHRWERQVKSAGEGRALNGAELHVLHRDFHRSLLSACGSNFMLRFWDNAFDLAQRYQFVSGRTGTPSPRDPVAEHRALKDAVLARDVERARSLHAEHLELTAMLVAEFGVPRAVGDRSRAG